MAFNYKSGPNNVGEYQASGLPYVTHSQAVAGTVNHIQFPFVTNEFNVKNNYDGILRVGFTENGVLGTNYFSLPVSGTFGGRIRITDLYVTAEAGTLDFEVMAGLTTVPRQDFFILTGALNVFSGSEAQQLQYGLRGLGYDGIG